jgi:hypothetical protein
MTRVSDDDVLLLWRALTRFRSGRKAACAPNGKPPRSSCPLYHGCSRWTEPDDELLSFEETLDQTDARRAAWPCSRLLDLLAPGVSRIG